MNILEIIGNVAGQVTKATIKVGAGSAKSLAKGYASAFKEPEVLSPTNVDPQSEKKEQQVQMELEL